MGFLAFPLLLPEASEAGGSTEFPGFRLLVLGYRNGVDGSRFQLPWNCLKTVAAGVHL